MIEFLTALGVFLFSHTIPARSSLRQRLTAAMGERWYLLLYSMLSIALLVWLISAALRAPFVPLWNLAPWQYGVPIALMLPASMLLMGGLFAPNPLSISLSRASFDPARPGTAGAPSDCKGNRSICATLRHHQPSSLSSGAQSCCLSVTSKKNLQKIQASSDCQKRLSLVVIRSLVVILDGLD